MSIRSPGPSFTWHSTRWSETELRVTLVVPHSPRTQLNPGCLQDRQHRCLRHPHFLCHRSGTQPRRIALYHRFPYCRRYPTFGHRTSWSIGRGWDCNRGVRVDLSEDYQVNMNVVSTRGPAIPIAPLLRRGDLYVRHLLQCVLSALGGT